MSKAIRIEYTKQIIYLAIACFFLYPGPLKALGLHLYSYTNDDGQRIIVSSENKIPLKYRATTEKKFIKAYTSRKKSVKKRSLQTAIKKDKPFIETNSKILLEPVAPVLDSMATASLLLAKFSTFQENSERLQVIAVTHGREIIEVRVRNSQNNSLLTEISELSSFKWEGHDKWISASHQLLRLMQNLQWSANQWMQVGNINIIQNRSQLLQQARYELENLKATFPKEKVKK